MLKFQAEITDMFIFWQKLLKFLQGVKGPFAQCDNVKFFLTQAMGSMATNGSVHTDTSITNIDYDIDLNDEIIFLHCRRHRVNGP